MRQASKIGHRRARKGSTGKIGRETSKEKAATPERTHVSIAGMKAKYGVTDAFIAMLGEPDELVDNPHYKCASPMKLYKIARVEAFIEQMKHERPGFMAKMQARKETATSAVETKKQTMEALTRELIAGLVIQPYDASKIPVLAERQHALHEIDVYGDVRHDWIGGFRAEVAYIRHQLTNYEEVLDKIKGRVGAGNAYTAIKDVLNHEIEEDYTSNGGENS